MKIDAPINGCDAVKNRAELRQFGRCGEAIRAIS
jgi:hypothetical protein